MNIRKKSVALAAIALSTVIATSAMALRWNGDVRRTEAIEGLIGSLEAAREASPTLRDAPYGETVDGSAWGHYGLAFGCVSEIDEFRDRCMELAEAETAEARGMGKDLLDEAGELFTHLKQGAHARDATRPIDWDANLSARLIRLTESRAIGQLVQAHAYRLIVQGRSVEAAQAMLDMQQFAADAMMSPSLFEEMIGCAFLAPDQFTCTPAPGGPGLTAEGKRAWLDGIREIQSNLPLAGRSYDGELELLARYLLDPAGRTERDWHEGSPGWRYGFSWETAAAKFALEMHERAPAYRAAMECPDGLDRLVEMDKEVGSGANPAAARCGNRFGSAAISRRKAIMRLGLVEQALALDIGATSELPAHPLGYPVDVEATERFVRVGSQNPNGYRIRFTLSR